uniref:Pyruvate kinase n=1 Tax=Macrostomum lignano TaxID=282301 RepID=A0A1I8JQH4_9PLAT
IDNGTRKAQEILIRRRLPNDNIELVESRLAVLGALHSGDHEDRSLCDHGPVLASVEAWLKATGNKRVPLVVQTKDDAITAADNIFQAGGTVLSFSAEVALHCRQRGGGGLSGGPLRHNQPHIRHSSSGLNSSKRRQQQQRRNGTAVWPVQSRFTCDLPSRPKLLRPGDRLVLRSGHRLLG